MAVVIGLVGFSKVQIEEKKGFRKVEEGLQWTSRANPEHVYLTENSL